MKFRTIFKLYATWSLLSFGERELVKYLERHDNQIMTFLTSNVIDPFCPPNRLEDVDLTVDDVINNEGKEEQ